MATVINLAQTNYENTSTFNSHISDTNIDVNFALYQNDSSFGSQNLLSSVNLQPNIIASTNSFGKPSFFGIGLTTELAAVIYNNQVNINLTAVNLKNKTRRINIS